MLSIFGQSGRPGVRPAAARGRLKSTIRGLLVLVLTVFLVVGMALAAFAADGPPPDTDGDGRNDSADRCPETVAGAPVDANDCSDAQKDSDGDGISDADDPNVRGATLPNTGNTMLATFVLIAVLLIAAGLGSRAIAKRRDGTPR